MHAASHGVVRAGGASGFRRIAFRTLVVAFLAIVAYGAVTAVREAETLDDRRAVAAASRTDPVTGAGEYAPAFERFREALGGSSTFALILGPAVGPDERGFLRLFAGYYLYPAIAVADPSQADAVMVFGTPAPAVRGAFERLGEHDGVWLGMRRGP